VSVCVCVCVRVCVFTWNSAVDTVNMCPSSRDTDLGALAYGSCQSPGWFFIRRLVFDLRVVRSV